LHIKKHIDAGIKSKYPYLNCSFSFAYKSSFTSHLSQYHRNWGINALAPNHVVSRIESPVIEKKICQTSASTSSFQTDETIYKPSPENFTKDLALFYLKLQAKKLVPISTV
jgi:hypothetical protein